MIYEEVFREFESNKVRYLVVGGVAVNIYGYVRMTVDLDLMVDLSDINLTKIVGAMEKLGYSPRAPVKSHELLSKEKRDAWIKKKGAVVFTFTNPQKPFEQVDLFLVNPMSFEEAYERGKHMNIGGINVTLISVDDLITMKTSTGRPRDLEDVHHLKKVMGLRDND